MCIVNSSEIFSSFLEKMNFGYCYSRHFDKSKLKYQTMYLYICNAIVFPKKRVAQLLS